MFVDDAYLFHATHKPDLTPKQLQRIVHHDINEWDRGLESTGGKLNGNKTKYMILHWLFTSEGNPYLDTKLLSDNIVQITAQSSSETIQQIPPDTHSQQFKSLGVRTPPTLSDNYEFAQIQHKSTNFAKFLESCPLTRKEAWVAFTMYFVPSYTYRAVTLSFNMAQITKIQRIFMPMLLNRLGFHSTFPRSIVFAPTHLGGMGIVPFNVIITQRKIRFLYRHLRAQTEISKVIMINLQWA